MKQLILLTFLISSLTSFGYGWIQKADFGGDGRHRTPMLSIGNFIYTGQGHYNGGGTNILFDDWWQYDPASNSWSQKADYPEGPVYHASGFVIGDYGYVGCGRTQPGGPGNAYVHETSFYRYDPASNQWNQIASFPGQGRRGAVSFAITTYGFVGTGETGGGGMLNDFYRYNSTNNTWQQIATMPTTGRVSAVGFALNGYGYVGTGGLGSWSASQNDFWRYDPTANTWVQRADVGPINRMEASGFALNGKGYILTGDNMSSGTNYSDMWEYNPTANVWMQIEDFPGTPRRYLAAVTHNGVAYCGLGTSGTNFKDFWMFDQTLYTIEKQMEEVEIVAYPNPVVDHLSIKLDGLNHELAQNLELIIYSMNGEIIHSQNFESSEMNVELNNLTSGTYIYKIMYQDKELNTDKLILL